MKAFIFSLAIIVSSNGFAKNHVVYFGGGYSNNPLDKFFNNGLRSSIEISKKDNWDGDFYYRKTLPGKINSADASRTKEFSESTFNQKLDQMLKETQPGEQLLVVLASHGMNKNGQLVIGSDSGSFDVSTLEPFIKKAEAKGIKLGIVGGACYSGTLQKYKSDKTCIITNSPRDKVGITTDTSDILKYLETSKGECNLEEAYLVARARAGKKASATMPMISTAAGTATDEMLYPLKFSVTRKEDLPYFLSRPICTRTELGMSQLEESIKNNNELATSILGSDVQLNYKDLKEKTMAYDEEFAETKDIVLMSANEICTQVQGQNVCMRLGAIDKFLRNKSEHSKNSPESVRVVEELAKSDTYKNYASLAGKWTSRLESLDGKAEEISKSERVLYDRIYKKMSEDPKIKNAPNPCRDFKI